MPFEVSIVLKGYATVYVLFISVGYAEVNVSIALDRNRHGLNHYETNSQITRPHTSRVDSHPSMSTHESSPSRDYSPYVSDEIDVEQIYANKKELQ